MVASAVFITDLQGKAIISRNYRGDVPLTKAIERETLTGFEPNEEKWSIEAQGSTLTLPGTLHSERGLAHDRMFGGIKGRRKSKKDKLREAAARAEKLN